MRLSNSIPNSIAQVLEVLFTKCTEAITDIASMVTGVRYLKVELQNVVIESLTAILDVFRIAASYAKSKRFSAFDKPTI
jgi:hypothetical protein